MGATLKIIVSGLIVWVLMVGALSLLTGEADAKCTGAGCQLTPPVYSHTGNWTLVRDENGRTVAFVRELHRI